MAQPYFPADSADAADAAEATEAAETAEGTLIAESMEIPGMKENFGIVSVTAKREDFYLSNNYVRLERCRKEKIR